MSSGLRECRIEEQMEMQERREELDRQSLIKIMSDVQNAEPGTEEAKNWIWLYKNKDKILGNKQLLEILR